MRRARDLKGVVAAEAAEVVVEAQAAAVVDKAAVVAGKVILATAVVRAVVDGHRGAVEKIFAIILIFPAGLRLRPGRVLFCEFVTGNKFVKSLSEEIERAGILLNLACAFVHSAT